MEHADKRNSRNYFAMEEPTIEDNDNNLTDIDKLLIQTFPNSKIGLYK